MNTPLTSMLPFLELRSWAPRDYMYLGLIPTDGVDKRVNYFFVLSVVDAATHKLQLTANRHHAAFVVGAVSPLLHKASDVGLTWNISALMRR